ncbi:MAG: pyridoxal phosphate-dependent aminotransferase [Sediminispirochaetaceae bacterium]
MKSIREKMNPAFRPLRGELFPPDVVSGQATGRDLMSWADPFFPDSALSEPVRQAMIAAIESGSPEHYAPPALKFELQELLARRVSERTGLELDPARHVLVTPGSDAALFYALLPFIEPGDEVLLPDPSYPKNYRNPELLGGVTVPVPLREEDGYQLRIDEVEKRITPRTKIIILCHPNNPTTTVHREERLRELSRLIIERDLILLCDQAFEDHIYDGISFVSPCTLPGMWERTLTICSTSKGIGLSGFRIGYIFAQEEIMQALYAGAGNVLGAASTLSTVGAVAALKDPDHLPEVFSRLEARRDLAYEILSGVPGVSMQPAESGIISWLNVSALGTGGEVADYILAKAGVEVSAGEQYGAQGAGHIRIVTGCYRDEEIAGGIIRRIRSALELMAEEKGIQE